MDVEGRSDRDEELTGALRDLPAPKAPAELGGQVLGRVRRVRLVQRTVAGTAAALVLAGLVSTQWPRARELARPEPSKVERLDPPRIDVPKAEAPALGLAAQALAGGPPIARLDVLAEQQSAVWQSLTDLTEEL